MANTENKRQFLVYLADNKLRFRTWFGNIEKMGNTVVDEPSHAEGVEFLVKELDSELASQQGHVFNDGQTHSPLGVTGQFHDCWQQGL